MLQPVYVFHALKGTLSKLGVRTSELPVQVPFLNYSDSFGYLRCAHYANSVCLMNVNSLILETI